jgi:hypothetical protein
LSFRREKNAPAAVPRFDLAQCLCDPWMQHATIETGRRHEMTPNVGTIDRIVRVALGLALIAFALGYIYPGTGWNWTGWIGTVPLLTAVFGYCPVYSVFGIATCSP